MNPKPEKLILKMTPSQHKKLMERIYDIPAKADFALLGQPHVYRKEIDVILLNKKQGLKLKKALKEIL